MSNLDIKLKLPKSPFLKSRNQAELSFESMFEYLNNFGVSKESKSISKPN